LGPTTSTGCLESDHFHSCWLSGTMSRDGRFLWLWRFRWTASLCFGAVNIDYTDMEA
jgi:hypothetical protein